MTPENPLEEALVAASTQPEARPEFYRLMLESPLYLIDDRPADAARSDTKVLEQDTRLQLQVIDIDGVQHVPIFSSATRLHEATGGNRGHLAIQGREMLQMLRGAHLVLNPGAEFGKQFPPDEVAEMLSGAIFGGPVKLAVAAGSQLVLGEPANYPRQLVVALQKLLRTMPEVKSARLGHGMIFGSDDPPHTILAIEAKGDFPALAARIMEVVQMVSRPGEMADLLDYRGAKELFRPIKPFYRRKLLGLF